MGQAVMTVTGPIPTDDLGVTLIHEHFTFAYPGWFADDSLAPYNRESAETECLKVLEDVKRFGVQTIVDATAADVGGRDPILLHNLSTKSGGPFSSVTRETAADRKAIADQVGYEIGVNPDGYNA